MTYAEKEIRSSTAYPCNATVARGREYLRPCKRQAVLLFLDGETIKAHACQQHRSAVRAALACDEVPA